MDYEDMDAKLKENKIHVAVFCNPHNPTGRVWEPEEIQKAMEVYKENDCIVIADEILQTVYAIIQRIGAAKQAPCAIYLTISGSFLQNQTFLIHSFVISYCTEEGISLQVFQCSQCGLHVILHHIRSILYRFYALLQDCVFIRDLSKSEFQESVFLRVICSDTFFYTI